LASRAPSGLQRLSVSSQELFKLVPLAWETCGDAVPNPDCIAFSYAFRGRNDQQDTSPSHGSCPVQDGVTSNKKGLWALWWGDCGAQ